MDKEELQPFLNKKVRLTLKNGYFYSCMIKYIGASGIGVFDRFGTSHMFDFDEIAIVNKIEKVRKIR